MERLAPRHDVVHWHRRAHRRKSNLHPYLAGRDPPTCSAGIAMSSAWSATTRSGRAIASSSSLGARPGPAAGPRTPCADGIGRLRHADLATGLRGALALGELHLDCPQLAEDLLGRVPLACHLRAPVLDAWPGSTHCFWTDLRGSVTPVRRPRAPE